MQHVRILNVILLVGSCLTAFSAAAAPPKTVMEDYVREPMPAGFQVFMTELDGPVFADATGHTLYKWPPNNLRNGDAGEQAGKPGCYDVHYRETVGFTSPYPAGRELPNADHRPTCIQHWPPVLAGADAKPIGKWTILDRTDGSKQWAYKGAALYTSHLDHAPGEAYGGNKRAWDLVSSGAQRVPVSPAPAIPSQFSIMKGTLGRLLADAKGYSVYTFDRDTPTKSNCTGSCLEEWEPIRAPEFAVSQGEWAVIKSATGASQWAYRGKLLYTHITDSARKSYEGSDVPGWHNVFVQPAPAYPKGFQVADTVAGQVIADSRGNTIYFYSCNEDTPDTLYCDTPDAPQEYRWAMCGGGDPARCLKTFPYVIADKSIKGEGTTWHTRDIDPMSGRYVAAGTPGSLHVWTYRDRPIYTYVDDHELGDINADAWGQDHGNRNGFKAFWLRDDFNHND